MHRGIVHLAVLALSVLAQAQEDSRAHAWIHPDLLERLRASAPEERVPVYFAMRARIARASISPHIRALGPRDRRRAVLAELEAHMQSSQAELMERLAPALAAGRARLISRNCLGNFLALEAPAALILDAARLPSIAEVWPDLQPPREQVEDSVNGSTLAAGNGPRDVRAEDVWVRGVDGGGIVWMVADSGCVIDHPGLQHAIWSNPGEVPGNGRDDDGNGFVDDVHGWNFSASNPDVDDAGGHGTSMCGVLVAREHSNGEVLGISPGARLMIARLGGERTQWDAILYAVRMGAHGLVSGHSYKAYAAPPPNYRMHRDVGFTAELAGLVRVNSTSNDGALCELASPVVRRPFNVSAPGCVPSPYRDPNQVLRGLGGGVIGCGAHVVGTANLASSSPCGPFAWYLPDLLANLPAYPASAWDPINHDDYPWQGGAQQGLIKPDITGPSGTLSTSGRNSYRRFAGTSNAAAAVAGCLVLAQQANSSLTPADLAMALHLSARESGVVSGKENGFGAGRVDAWELVKLARNLHRVNGSPAWEVAVPAGRARPDGWRLQLDGSPDAFLVILMGTARGELRSGELTVRLADGAVLLGAFADSEGRYDLDLPTFPALVGFSIITQILAQDTAFGPATGSNAIETRFVF